MQKKKGCRAWNILRLAFKWTRKSAESRRTLVMDLRKFLKGIAHCSDPVDALSRRRYGERQMSFDATPVVHVRMHRPRYPVTIFSIPCIKPPNIHFECDDDEHEHECGRLSLFEAEEDQESRGGFYVDDDDDEIDLKADQFITRFYQQMKIQNK